jgi:uncharacterized protein YbjT (DUF2867 family)
MIGGRAPYSKMKQGVEDTIESLGFEQAIILRPGFIIGQREAGKEKAGGGIISSVITGLGSINQGIQDTLGQEADVIARAAVQAALLAKEGKAPSKYWILEGADIIKFGREAAEADTKPVA